MPGPGKITCIILILAASSNATTTTKDVRTAGLPEKIIGGVIEIVHSHKNKPSSTQQTFQQPYPPNQGYPPQYQYQNWNGQPYPAQPTQGFNYQSQYQNQGQYYQGTTYPQNTGNYVGQTYPSGGPVNSQAQSQGQYQVIYQNQPNGQYGSTGQYGTGQYGTGQYGSGQYGTGQYGTSGQYQNNQSNQQFQQNQQSGSFQGQNQNTGSYQGQKYPSNNVQGQNGSSHAQGSELGGQNQNFQGSGGHQGSGNGAGPTCVCQAWTKPNEVLNDPTAEKTEKMNDEPSM